MPDFHCVSCIYCEQTFHTAVGETKCDLCGKVGGLTDPDRLLAERIRREAERPPSSPRRTIDDLIADPSTSPARKVGLILAGLLLLNGYVVFRFAFQKNGLGWVHLGALGVMNLFLVGVSVWRLQRGRQASRTRQNTPAPIPAKHEPATEGPEAPAADAVRPAEGFFPGTAVPPSRRGLP